MSEITLHLGDCLEFMRTMSDKSVDAVITDPPYFGREDLFATNKLLDILSELDLRKSFVFWPANYEYPFEYDSLHIWHKSIPIHPNSKIGNVAGHQFERIYSRGFGKQCKVFRVAAIIPNFAACKNELVAHPTQKPLSLMKILLEKTKPNGTIFDPFMGSGTTGVACVQTGRNFIGCEIDPGYFEIAKRRIAEAQPCLTI